MFRKFKHRVNRILFRLGFAPLFLLALTAACSRCTPAPSPTEPTTTTSTSTSTTGGDPSLPARCAHVCANYRESANDCVQRDLVCARDGYDSNDECVKWLTCEEACEESADSTDYYLGEECEPR